MNSKTEVLDEYLIKWRIIYNMELNLCTIDWVAIGAIATLLMVIATYISLRLNHKQIEEIKRQWKEENRARLSFSIIAQDGLFLLKISNIGKNTAYDIQIKFCKDFIDSHFSNYIKNHFIELQSKSFIIEAGVNKYIYISPIYGDSDHTIGGKEHFTGTEINKWLDTQKTKKIIISGMYCNTYMIHESFCIDDFIINSIIVNDGLTTAVKAIKKGSIVQNDSYMPIQKSLHVIAEALENIKNNISDEKE